MSKTKLMAMESRSLGRPVRRDDVVAYFEVGGVALLVYDTRSYSEGLGILVQRRAALAGEETHTGVVIDSHWEKKEQSDGYGN